jgi:hypothetical protein
MVDELVYKARARVMDYDNCVGTIVCYVQDKAVGEIV